MGWWTYFDLTRPGPLCRYLASHESTTSRSAHSAEQSKMDLSVRTGCLIRGVCESCVLMFLSGFGPTQSWKEPRSFMNLTARPLINRLATGGDSVMTASKVVSAKPNVAVGSELLEFAIRANEAGLCVLPPRQDGSKRPDALSWTRYQTQRPTEEREAAAFLHISPRTLQRWRWAGGGPQFIQIGSRIRYAQTALEDFVERRQRTRAMARRAHRR